ncbi:MAG: HIT domain-containing protein [Candidatus Nezhaarchaeota archaeon]|nr:HIT domain-containing protein [Candidatus Nezhaarchaeota archaeon]
MERNVLWAPWRMEYVSNVASHQSGCFLCTKPSEGRDEENLILHRGRACFIILNAYPYNTGHLLIAPYAHKPSLVDLSDEELLDLMKCTSLGLKVLGEAFRPDGFNVGLNLGRCAGAGLEGHVHVHVVPRWIGDTNFMPVIANTKVLPELLSSTYSRLKGALAKAARLN